MPTYTDLNSTSFTWQAAPAVAQDTIVTCTKGTICISFDSDTNSASLGRVLTLGQAIIIPAGVPFLYRAMDAVKATASRQPLALPPQVMSSVQRKLRETFPGAALDATRWASVVGAGQTVGVASGVLTVNAGTTANAETILTLADMFSPPFRVAVHLTLSQRIINQEFILEAVSVDPTTGAPDGKSAARWILSGSNVNQGAYETQGNGIAAVLASGQAIVSPAAPGSIFEIEPFADECWWHCTALDTPSGRSNSYRRHQNAPDPNALYKLRIRVKNGATAPASATTLTVGYVSVVDYMELTAEITGGRGQGSSGQGLGVIVANSPTVTANVGTNAPTVYTDSSTPLAAGATFTGTTRDLGVAIGVQQFVANAFADQAGTLRIEKSTDGTTWRLAEQVAVAAGVPATLRHPVTTRYVRDSFVNGATLQAAFLLTSAQHRI